MPSQIQLFAQEYEANMHSNRQLLTSILARLESLEQHIQEISQGMLQNNEVLRNKFNEVDTKQQSVQSVQSVQSSATLNNNEVIKKKIGLSFTQKKELYAEFLKEAETAERIDDKFNEVDTKQQSVQIVQSVQSSATLNNNELIKQKIWHLDKAVHMHQSELDKYATKLDIVNSVSSSVSV